MQCTQIQHNASGMCDYGSKFLVKSGFFFENSFQLLLLSTAADKTQTDPLQRCCVSPSFCRPHILLVHFLSNRGRWRVNNWSNTAK